MESWRVARGETHILLKSERASWGRYIRDEFQRAKAPDAGVQEQHELWPED